MREISITEITAAVEKLCVKSAMVLPPALGVLLECAYESEQSEAGRYALGDIVENFKYAASCKLPICQDTGMAVVFAEIGQEVHVTGGDFEECVNEGVRRGYSAGALRMSVVRDPLKRENTNDNTPCVLYTNIVLGDKITLRVAPKGFGSENMSRIKMFLPTSKLEEIEEFIVETVRLAGSNPCPPVVVGVGLGGTFEKAAMLSKRALIREADKWNPDPFYAEMERRVLEKINALNIGPQGFSGNFTAVKVSVDVYATHIAGLPCAVNMGCHAMRHATAVL